MARLRIPPATTVEQEERENTSLAVALVRKRLEEGTATSQETTYYLQLASPLNKAKAEKVQLENELLRAKIDAIRSAETSREMYESAMKAFAEYIGQDDEEEDDYYYDDEE